MLDAKLADPALAHWAPWLRDVRVFRPHQLSDEVERLLHEKEVTGRAAWSRLFDETVAAMRVPLAGEELTVSAALNKLSDRDRAVREAAGARRRPCVFGDNIRLFALTTNTLAKDKEIIDTWRHYPHPGSYRNRANMVEDEVVEALVTAVTADFPRLSHRYYLMKAKWLGLEKLQHWDRNAPLPGDDRPRGVLAGSAARACCGRMAPSRRSWRRSAGGSSTSRGSTRRLRPGKSGGAFAHPTVPVGASVSAGELSRPHARRDDAGA